MDKRVYFGLAVIGLVLPYSQFIVFLMKNGVDLGLIIHEITAYRISTFAWLDVVVTAIVVIVDVMEEKADLKQWWLPVAASLLIGPSCGLPLYLYMRSG
jgi:hypothetical protein